MTAAASHSGATHRSLDAAAAARPALIPRVEHMHYRTELHFSRNLPQRTNLDFVDELAFADKVHRQVLSHLLDVISAAPTR